MGKNDNHSLTLEEQVVNLTKIVADLQKENEQFKQHISGLPAATAETPAEAPTIPTEPFEVDGAKYMFTVPKLGMMYKNAPLHITAKDACSDPELLAFLVKGNYGCIKKIA